MKKNRILSLSADDLAAAASGGLFSLSLLSPWFGALGWICFVPLLLALREKRPLAALRLGMVAGTSMNLLSLYWLAGTLTRFGGIPPAASAAALLVFCVYSSLQFGIFALFVSRCGLLRSRTLRAAVVVSLAWTAAEHFFPVLFPYGIGVSQSHYPLVIQAVDLLGMSFLGFLMFFVNVCAFYLAESMGGHGKRLSPAHAAACVAVAASVLAYGSFRMGETERLLETKPEIEVGMVQANFGHDEKNTDNEPEITRRHGEMSLELADVDLVIWPETSAQFWFERGSAVYRTDDGRDVVPPGHRAHFLIGGLSFAREPGSSADGAGEEGFAKYNTAFLLDPEGSVVDSYSKTRLFLFGEYFPWINGPLGFLKEVFPMIGDLTPGESLGVLGVPGKNVRIGTLICYEDIMAGISREYSNRGANLLVNITNDAWFGKSAAPFQHLLLSIPRAVETRRYLVRSTNSGITAIISPTGEVEAKTGIFTTENLKGKVRLVDSAETLYGKVGDAFPRAALAVIALFLLKTYLGRKYAD